MVNCAAGKGVADGVGTTVGVGATVAVAVALAVGMVIGVGVKVGCKTADASTGVGGGVAMAPARFSSSRLPQPAVSQKRASKNRVIIW